MVRRMRRWTYVIAGGATCNHVSPDFSADLFSEQLALMRMAAEIDDRSEPRVSRPGAFAVNDPSASVIQRTEIRAA